MVDSFSGYVPLIRERLAELVRTGRDPVDQILLQPLQRQGKLIRPQLVLLSADLFGPITRQVIDVGVAIECIHTASLVHDDIIDKACLRRGVPTVNHLHGSHAAVLAGDHLFATAFEILTRHRLNSVLEEVTGAIRRMCAGEITQDLNLYNTAQTEENYLDNIWGKTASLFGVACRCGALVAGATAAEVEQVGWFGESLGYAYQIADDLLDFLGEEEILGKPRGGDLRNGVITLPVIHALASSTRRQELKAIIESIPGGAAPLANVNSILHECGAFSYTAARALEYRSQACRALELLPPTRARERLLELCSTLIQLPLNAVDLQRAELTPEEGLCRPAP